MSESNAQGYLPYGRQQITDDDIEAVVEALRAPRITQGPRVEQFEEALCEYTDADYCCVVSSGTAALHLAYASAGIVAGDEIITSPITFAATANAARYLGADVRFADVDPQSGNISVDSVSDKITANTKAIVPVHLGGLPCDMRELRNLADSKGIALIEDAAHALGATYSGDSIGSGIADMATFSFHPVKHLTTGEGGAITTNSKELKERMDRLRHHGIEREPEYFSKPSPGRWYHEVSELGYNYRLTDFQCALGLSQLTRQAEGVARRREIAARYTDAFREMSGAMRPQRISADRFSAFHLFALQIDFDKFSLSRDELMSKLDTAGIGTQVHYIPVNQQPYYIRCYGEAETLPGVEEYYARTLSLPMYAELSDSDVDYVVGSLLNALGLSADNQQTKDA